MGMVAREFLLPAESSIIRNPDFSGQADTARS